MSILLHIKSTLLVHVQKIENNHEQLAKIGERTDEIKDLHTRHELTVKRNREVKSISALTLIAYSHQGTHLRNRVMLS